MRAGDVVGARCNSVFGPTWRRVGVMTSQYTNLGKTCGVSGELASCRPVTTPVRMCGMPWERRYGLPSSINNANLVRQAHRVRHTQAGRHTGRKREGEGGGGNSAVLVYTHVNLVRQALGVRHTDTKT